MSRSECPTTESILTREQALCAVLTSLALEETALGHIMNAESEIIQYVSEYMKGLCDCDCDADLQKFSEINSNVSALLQQVSDMETVLKNKLRFAVDCLPDNSGPQASASDCCPPYPNPPSSCAAPAYHWADPCAHPFPDPCTSPCPDPCINPCPDPCAPPCPDTCPETPSCSFPNTQSRRPGKQLILARRFYQR